MFRPNRSAVLAAIVLVATAEAAIAQDAAVKPDAPVQGGAAVKGYPAETLLSTGTTILGETIRYPTSGPAHVTASIITLAPGGRTITHKHGVPLFAYILEGELTVDYGKRGTRTYKPGDSFMEAMNVAHFGVNKGAQPVRLIAVYMGAKRARDVIPSQ